MLTNSSSSVWSADLISWMAMTSNWQTAAHAKWQRTNLQASNWFQVCRQWVSSLARQKSATWWPTSRHWARKRIDAYWFTFINQKPLSRNSGGNCSDNSFHSASKNKNSRRDAEAQRDGWEPNKNNYVARCNCGLCRTRAVSKIVYDAKETNPDIPYVVKITIGTLAEFQRASLEKWDYSYCQRITWEPLCASAGYLPILLVIYKFSANLKALRNTMKLDLPGIEVVEVEFPAESQLGHLIHGWHTAVATQICANLWNLRIDPLLQTSTPLNLL